MIMKGSGIGHKGQTPLAKPICIHGVEARVRSVVHVGASNELPAHTSVYLSIRQHTECRAGRRQQHIYIYTYIYIYICMYVCLRSCRCPPAPCCAVVSSRRCQYVYFCTSKASQLSTAPRVSGGVELARGVSFTATLWPAGKKKRIIKKIEFWRRGAC